MPFCATCGSSHDASAAYCAKCGRPLAAAPPADTGARTGALPTVRLARGPELARLLGFIGAVLLFVGVFTPVISFPIVGSVNYYQNGNGDGLLLLLVALLAGAFAFKGRHRWQLWTGLAALVFIAITFVRFQMKVDEIEATMTRDFADNPLAGLAGLALSTVQYRWGWTVLILGGLLLLGAAWAGRPVLPAGASALEKRLA